MSNLKLAKCLALTSVAALAFASPAQSQSQLDSALQEAKRSTAASAQSQQTVERLNDEADNMLREYSALLQRRDSLEIFVARQELYLESQTDQIASLREQLSTVEQTKQDLVPLMIRMVVDLESEVKADYPFQRERRLGQVKKVMNSLADPAVPPVEQYRNILTAYQNEIIYGQGMDSYEGPHPENPKRTVDYIRFGRVSFVYMTKEEDEIKFYNLETGGWDDAGTDLAMQMRQAIRIAKGEATKEIVVVPVKLVE